MAITVVTSDVTAAVTVAAATAIPITEPTTLLAENFAVGEYAIVYILGPSGDYMPATNKDGQIVLSAHPSIAVLEAPGTYKVSKTATADGAYIGYGA